MNLNLAKYKKKFPQVKELSISKSNREGKRFVARFVMYGKQKTIHFGLHGAYTYFDGAPKSKRNAYRARASKITNLNGDYTYKIAGTANSFSYHLLW